MTDAEQTARDLIGSWIDRSLLLEDLLEAHGWLRTSLEREITQALAEARRAALEEAAQISSLASIDEQSPVQEYWPVRIGQMNESARTAAHLMAQSIAAQIRAAAGRR